MEFLLGFMLKLHKCRIPPIPRILIHIPRGFQLHPYTRSPIHPFTRSPIHPFTRLPVYPFTRSPVYPFTRSPVHLFTRSPIHPFILHDSRQYFTKIDMMNFEYKKKLYLAPSINQKTIIMRKITVLLLSLCLAAPTLFGGGYQVHLHSMRNIGMGLIGTSLSYDASSLFYNPGGTPFLEKKWSFSGGVNLLMSRVTFQHENSTEIAHLDHELNTPLYFYAAFKPTKNLSVGLAVNTPYGNGLSWGEKWQGRYLIQDISFKAFTFQPTVSYKFGDFIGIGVGLVYATGSVNMNKAIPLQGSTGDGKMNITGNTSNFGFNAGVMVHPVKGLSLGLDYRSKIEMKVKGGDATFTVPQSLSTNFPNNKVDVMLPLPANLDFGASYEFGKNKQWMVGLNLCYVFWGTYDSLVFTFEKTTAAVGRTAQPTLYSNKLVPRIGAQYRMNETFTFRIGGYFDQSPVKDDYLNPQTPSLDQIGLTCGASIYPLKGFSIDLSFLYITGKERTGTYSPENFAGTYKNQVFIPGIGLTYCF